MDRHRSEGVRPLWAGQRVLYDVVSVGDRSSDRRGHRLLVAAWRCPPVLAASMWAAAWVLMLATGQRYSLRVLYAGWQFLPADSVASDPVGSVWHLHTQPPLWNAVVAAISAWSPLSLTVSHAIVSVATGSCLAASVCAILGRVGAGRSAALSLTAVATLNSQVLGMAWAPMYDLAVAALLAALTLACTRLFEPGVDDRTRSARLLVLSGIGTVLVMTRALYHPAWWLVTILVVIVTCRRLVSRNSMVVALALVLIPTCGWSIKNQVMFGSPSLSSWTGMNLLRATVPAVPLEDLERLHNEGNLSAVALQPSFADYAAYVHSVPPCESAGEHSVLSSPTRRVPDEWQTGLFKVSVVPNYNFVCYLAVYRQAGHDAWVLFRAEPTAWLRARGWAINNWFREPPSPPDAREMSVLWPAVDRLTDVALLRVPEPRPPQSWSANWPWVSDRPWSVVLVGGSAAVTISSLRGVGWRRVGGAGTPPNPPRDKLSQSSAFRMTGWILAWTALAGIFAELGEQHRFRAVTDPLTLSLGGLALCRFAARRWRNAEQARS